MTVRTLRSTPSKNSFWRAFNTANNHYPLFFLASPVSAGALRLSY